MKSVIKMLEKEYEKAKKLSHIRDPLAYALYRVWLNVDERNK